MGDVRSITGGEAIPGRREALIPGLREGGPCLGRPIVVVGQARLGMHRAVHDAIPRDGIGVLVRTRAAIPEHRPSLERSHPSRTQGMPQRTPAATIEVLVCKHDARMRATDPGDLAQALGERLCEDTFRFIVPER